ncbi:hypothetical protein SDC9_133772 [bioreactor metagenome]|uniref:Uncharacterized protein n=1 Tax=bioreactor metagenome TaxID=1076179 RepID=A0A645DBI8_9ZZZZ
MAGSQINGYTRNQIVIQLIQLIVDLRTFGGISFSNTLIEQSFELSFQFIRHVLATTVRTGGVRLIPVVRVMDIFQPTSGHHMNFVSALCSQVGRPGQTKDLNEEFIVDGRQAVGDDLCHDLAGGIAGVVKHLQAEAYIPNIGAISFVASGDAIVIEVSQLEFSGRFLEIEGIVGGILVIAGHTRHRQFDGLNSFAIVYISNEGIPVEGIAESFADVDISKEIRGNAIAIQHTGSNVRI